MQWEQLYERHARGLLLFARQWFPGKSDAEDVVQEGFLRTWRAWEAGHVDPERATSALFGSVRFAALDRLRSGQRRKLREERAADDLYDEQEAWFEPTLEHRERNESIQRALHELPDDQREVLVMKIWSELTFREIAEALGIPPNTAASRYRYGLKALRRKLPELLATLVDGAPKGVEA